MDLGQGKGNGISFHDSCVNSTLIRFSWCSGTQNLTFTNNMEKIEIKLKSRMTNEFWSYHKQWKYKYNLFCYLVGKEEYNFRV